MGDEIEFTKLPLEECCTHKLWKARVHGYTEAAKLFKAADDEKAPVFNQFVGLMGKFVGDSNAAAQEKGLEAVLLFVQNAAIATKTVKDVMSVIVAKSIAAPKAKTKELSLQIVLMYVEIEKQEQVIEELVKGLEHKNPKIVAACVSAITQSLREFGSKVIGIKPFIKFIGPLLEDRDKTVRDEGKAMVVEIYRWIKDAVKPQLSSLKPVHLSELEVEFEKVKGEKAVPTRLLRSQQEQQAKMATEQEENGGGGDGVERDDEPCAVDPYDLMDPINVLSQIPGDFYEKLEAKKWQLRKEAIESLEKLLEYPKFEKGDYAELVRALLKVITKDSNVIVVGIAVKCIGRLALGLKKGFQPYAGTVLPNLLEKFKEKKANVVTPLREAVDAIYPITTLEAIQEDLLASLDNKNPAVKAETASFLARCFAKCTPAILNKKILKTFTTALLKTLNESDPTVRDNSAEALGTAMKVVGEKVITQFMPDLDNIKLNKIKEFCEKAVVVKAVAVKPQTAGKAERSKSETVTAGAKVVTKQGSAPKKVSSVSAVKKVSPTNTKGSKQAEQDRELSDEAVEEMVLEFLPEDVVKGIADAAWKVRLESTEAFLNAIKSLDEKDSLAQVLIKTLAKKPGLKETNFQVLKLKLEALKYVLEHFAVSVNIVDVILEDVADKLGDPKNGALAAELLTALSEATDFSLIANQVLEYAFNQKSPKVQQEAMNWAGEAMKEFGCVGQPKSFVEKVKKGLNATNAAVRTSAVTLCGVLYLYLGNQLTVLLDEKPAVMALLNAEFEKHEGEKPPPTIRGSKKSDDSINSEDSGSSVDDKPEEKVTETVSRIDISTKITDQLISELGDKNWKTRNEALMALSSIVNDAKSIKSNLGELPTVLCQRVVDSNGKLALLALDICRVIATAMGPQCKIHMKTFFRGFLTALGDSKQWVRSAALACINTWGAEGGYKEYFEGEVIPDALKTGSPTLRTEIWTWLADLLPNAKTIPKDEVILCVPYLYNCMEDRNSDVRKSAQSAILPIMIHVGYGNMVKQTEKLTPGSKSKIVAVLEKLRPELPAQPEPAKAAAKGRKPEDKKAEGKVAAKGKTPAPAKTFSRKKEEEVDLTPMLPVNSMKNQRMIDEQKLKTLKWNFTMPRSEFVDLLREQMTNAGLNKTLIVNMFHADFKFHLRAIDSLSEEIGNAEAIIANLDLILRWMTLRFFDTNPSVLLKGLEYLQNVFSLLIDNGYTVFDIEANSFIPYLVIKLGDPKDTVRDRVRAIIKQLSQMYPPGKLFVLIMDGLKSKNARQRAECLEELGNLIEEFGMSVCQPTPSSTLKEISKQISDRDNAVRSAALNAIVKAWFIEGDKVYKLIGQLSEKDMSLLEERVKRASKSRTVSAVQSKSEPKEKEKTPEKNITAVQQPPPEEVEEEIEEAPPSAYKQRQSNFGANLFKELDLVEPPMPKIDLIEIDDSFLDSPVTIPERIAAKLNKNSATPTFKPKDLLMEHVIHEMGSPNIEVAFQAATKLRMVFASEERNGLIMYTDMIMDSFLTQLKLVNSYSLDKYGLVLRKTYAMLFRIIDDIFGKKTAMASAIKTNHLQMLVQELLVTLAEDKTATFADGGYNRLINAFISRIIENADHTNITCALIRSLFDVMANPPSNPKIATFTTKCFVKVIVLIKQGNSNWLWSLDLDEVLYECHLFFQAYPRHTWKDRPQGPQKAIKTLLLVLVSLKGKSIFSHLKKIENPCASELSMFLKRLLKSQAAAAAGGTTTTTTPSARSASSTRLPKAMTERLSDIFMKIANEETAKEGLLQFYEFKKQNPNLDLSAFLAPTSKYFQDYVENGLRNIERERGALKHTPRKTGEPVTMMAAEDAATPAELTVDSAGLAQYYLDKLRVIQARVGIHVSDLPDFKNDGQC
ncbi:UNVERIFIED_CONTAM: hypothetical protein PYX00_000354 [Menopon gallinae]|uniref:TOG domain-containing protein n=1 Tax=Menopon gallinae TaxID=328185 RepID=A0AAW2I8T3_9NEOP